MSAALVVVLAAQFVGLCMGLLIILCERPGRLSRAPRRVMAWLRWRLVLRRREWPHRLPDGRGVR